MKNLSKLALGLALSGLMITSCQNERIDDVMVDSSIEPTSTDGKIIPGQYIVMFKDSKIEPASKVLAKSNFTDREEKAKAVREISEVSIQKMNGILSKK